MAEYKEDNVKTLEWYEHIRLRPGMYIGKLGDGASHDDGIYVLLKEVIDNSIDEFMEGNGRVIEVSIKEDRVRVRDYGRGIPLGSAVDCVSKINTGAKYDDVAFNKSIGMNGVGVKAVNALSSYFKIESVRDKKIKVAEFSQGQLTQEYPIVDSEESNGTIITFIPDKTIFENYKWYTEYIEKMLWNYAYLNRGLVLNFNGTRFVSKNGLLDLLTNAAEDEFVYPPIYERHLPIQQDEHDTDLEFAFAHTNKRYGEEYYSFVNGQYTIQGGTHQQAFREVLVKAVRDFYKKDFEPSDIRNSIVAALSIKIKGPVFESQTKIKLGSTNIAPEGGISIRTFIEKVAGQAIDKYLHKNPETADALLKKILDSEKERKEIAGIKKTAKAAEKKVNLHNNKLRDCRFHLNDKNRGVESTIFITEGDSASGSITMSRDANVQAVFSLRGKPLNTFKSTRRVIYDNEEFNLLQAALNLEDGLEGLRYNNIVIATDADVDGMHIRLLLLTFFLKFFPDLVRSGHVYILQTPLFRVRNKHKTLYCYTDEERLIAIKELSPKPEITRFKGLGEISPPEFKYFIGKNIRLDPVMLQKDTNIDSVLEYYMGDNTMERQQFIIDNLITEEDLVD